MAFTFLKKIVQEWTKLKLIFLVPYFCQNSNLDDKLNKIRIPKNNLVYLLIISN